MRRLLGLALAAMMASALVACDNGGGDDCDDVIDPCTEAGAARCSSGAVQECRENADGCLAWAEVERCGSNQSCTETGGTAACECNDTCETGGDSRCNGAVVEECEADPDGCLVWEAQTNCGLTGQSCDDSAGEAECVGGCESNCTTEGATHCTPADAVETCTDAGAGCLRWQETTDCTDDGWVCVEDGGSASCVAPCVPDCVLEGSTRCNGDDDIEICTDVGDDCLQWQLDEDCDDAAEVCDDAAEPAVCAPACESTCVTAGAVQCSAADDVETCTDVGDGCLQWQLTDDCDATTEECDETATPPVCVELCISDCPAAADTRCGPVSGGVETCTDVGGGCLQWALTDDCVAGFRTCDSTATPAVCGDLTAGDSCADPIVVAAASTRVAGADFLADFTDLLALGGTDCRTRTGSVEAVFQVDLAAGEGVLVRELGSLDAVLSLQTACGDAEACVFSQDAGETTGHRYQATADETVFVIVEAYYASTTSRAYDIAIDVWTDEVCNDGLDNDIDGLADCDDDQCFGFDPDCLTELNCGDGEDNDADTLVDCDDSDCDAAADCAYIPGIYEVFSVSADHFDIEGMSVTFTPDPAAAAGYTWTYATGSGDFPVTPSSSAAPVVLTLADDSDAEHVLTTMPSFTFFGVTYTSLFVGSNGYIAFGAGPDVILDSASELFAQPMIAALGEDLNPAATAAGDVVVDEFADRVVVTYLDVPFFAETPLNRFQVILNATGSIELHWVAVPPAGLDSTDTIVVGISSGLPVGLIPPEVDLIPPPPPSAAGDVIVTEIMYDPDFVGDTAGEWFELYNTTDVPLELEGAVFTDLGTDSFTVAGSLVIAPHGYLVLGRNADTATNGGVEIDYLYPGGGYALGNTDDEIVLTVGGVEIDAVAWDEGAGWPAAVGASIQLSTFFYDDTENDAAASWCLGTAAFGTSTDLGTPGGGNGNCLGVVHSTDFEADPGWALTGDWAWGTAATVGPLACAGGTGCIGTNLTGNYANSRTYSANSATFGPFDASALTLLALEFDMWLQTESGWDFASVEASTDGATWATVPMTTPAYTRPTSGPFTEWTGAAATAWTAASGDLSAHAGSATLYVRFVLRSDGSGTYPGFYVDNFALTGI